MDKISVIIPVYKVEDYLDRCVESIVNQTFQNIEIILVDDGSPDNCPALCDLWAQKDERVLVIHKENGGLSSARNCGIRKATGDYILFIDSDDYIEEDSCERLINYAEGADFIRAEATIRQPDQIIHRVHTNLEENRIYTGPEMAILEIRKNEWFAAACYNMYNREFLLKNNLFFLEGVLHEDNEFTPRLYLCAEKVKYLHYEFYQYIIRENSITGVKSKKNLDNLMVIYGNWKKLNDSIQDPETKKAYDSALSKYFITTCRRYQVTDKTYPEGITDKYLLSNALNFKEYMKTLVFVAAPKLYVKL